MYRKCDQIKKLRQKVNHLWHFLLSGIVWSTAIDGFLVFLRGDGD
nr:MAG TPA: hypothetical protein [Caudoviricetes sp.]